MEVSGKPKGSGKKVQIGKTQKLCEPCRVDSITKQSDGYCKDCEEFMCNTCFKDHLKGKLCRKHVMVDGHLSSRLSGRPESEVKCKQHIGETVKFYCPIHDVVGCGDCVVQTHNACKAVFISNMSENFQESQEFKTLVSKIEKLSYVIDRNGKTIQENRRINKVLLEKALSDIEQFREEFNKYLDKIEADVISEAKALITENEKRLIELEKHCALLSTKIKDTKQQLNDKCFQDNALFINTVENRPNVSEVENEIAEIQVKQLRKFEFVPDTQLQDLVTSNKHLGQLVATVVVLNPRSIQTPASVKDDASTKTAPGIKSTGTIKVEAGIQDKGIKQPKLVVALDIGTQYSGYAWQTQAQYETNPNDVHFNTNWGSGALQLHKTTTCILLKFPTNDKGEVPLLETGYPDATIAGGVTTEIGSTAEKINAGLLMEENWSMIDKQYYFFKDLKLTFNRKDFKRKQLIDDQSGKYLPFFDVMSLFINALKNHCLTKLKNKGYMIEMEKTLFVVTVPAIWSEEAKTFLRDTAIKTVIGEKHVLLALEPEATAIHCLHLPKGQKTDLNDLGRKDQKFLVADLGGGTADLSVVKVIDEDALLLDEICPPLGRNVGGEGINFAFFQACLDCFECEDSRQMLFNATPVELMKIESDFESKKVTIGTNNPLIEFIDIEFPAKIRDKLQDGKIKLKENNFLKFDNRRRTMMFNSTFVRDKLFKETCGVVYKTISNVLNREESKGLKTVVLVGGLSESPIVIKNLREMICNDFPDINVFVPSSPYKAVLMGAVLFGHDPFKFKRRISRYTFGIAINSQFNAKVHDEGKKWYNEEEGIYYCKELFDIHVRKDQSVLLGSQQPTKSYIPLYKTQKQIGLPIYSSTSLNPKYVTGEGCKNIGKITVDIPDSSCGADREAEVTMIYGGTQLSVVAKDKATGQEYKANISFNSE